MFKKSSHRWLVFLLAFVLLFSFPKLTTSAADVAAVKQGSTTIQNGEIEISWNGGSNASTGAISGTSGTFIAQSSSSAAYSNTVTITNKTDGNGKLSFSYSIDKYSGWSAKGSCSLEGQPNPYSITLGSGESITITLTGAKAGLVRDTKLTLTGIALEKLASTVTVTFNYNSGAGSVKVGETTVAAGNAAPVPTTGTTLVATAAEGCSFAAWVNDADNKILSTNATYTLVPSADMSISAHFTSSTPLFMVNDTYLFDDLEDAANMQGATTVVLLNSGTVPSGNYTIPVGVTLLIPKDNSYEVQTTRPAYATANEFSETPPAVSAYRTLTLADGANITVNGAISIGGTQRAGGNYAATPTGACGFIRMNSGSNITLNSGAKLYAWGFICGSGNVVAKSGATVYESFQVGGWRGGDETTTMNDKNNNGVFPMSQYYVQNIEAPLKLEAGAKELCVLSVNVSLIGVQALEVAFVGSADSMFTISSGYVLKDYIESEDRMKMEGHGDVSLTPISLSIQASVIGTINIESQKYDLPINGNITLHIAEGTITANQDVALLPGVRVILDEGTKCILGEGVSMYVYDSDEWGGYCGSGNANFLPALNVPGRTYTRTAADLKDASILINGEVDASKGYIYTTAGGANIYTTGTGKITTKAGTQTVTHQRKHGVEDVAISITPAKLKNADGTYLETASATDATIYEYCEPHGVWYTGECETCAAKVEYTISWDTNGDGTVDDTTTVEAGTMPTHADGSKAATAEYTYTFTGWSPAIAAAAGNVTYTAQFSKNPKSYTVTWKVDGQTHKTGTYAYGAALTQIAAPTKEGYTFSGWSTLPATMPANDVTVTGTFTVNQYTITWKNNDGSVLGTTTVAYGTVPTHADPTKAANGCTSYTFAGWSPAPVAVTGEATYTATYTETTNHSYGKITYVWDELQCTATRTCGVCNAPQTASVTGTVVTVEATHTEAGSKAYTATFTGDDAWAASNEKVEEIPAQSGNHTYENWTQTKAPTCTEPGEKTGTCVCGQTSTQTIPKTNHEGTTEERAQIDATCVTTGNEAGTYCTACNKYINGGAVIDIDPTAHSFTKYTYNNDAKCEVNGTETATCDRDGCNETDTRAKTGTALAHVDDNHDHKCDHNCGKTDMGTHADASEDKDHVCDYCKGEIENGETCFDAADDNDHKCDVCGASCGDHDYNKEAATESHKATAATCVAPATYYYSCDCGAHNDQTFAHGSVDPTNHVNKENKAKQEPTCVDDGYEAGVYCNDCKTWVSGHGTITALNHEMTKVVAEKVNATCTTNGTEAVMGCTRCDHTEGGAEITATGHTFGETTAAAHATCLAPGNEAYKHCANCGLYFAADEATNSAEGKENVSAFEIPAAHTYGELVEATDPVHTQTELTAGVAAHYLCTACGKYFTTEMVETTLDDLRGETPAHSYTAVVTEPTCTEEGYTTYTCSCGDSYVGNETDALGHKYEAVVTAPSCVSEGFTTYTCSVCKDAYIGDKVEALQHETEYVNHNNGSHSLKCKNCDYVSEATPHSFDINNDHKCVCGEVGTITVTWLNVDESEHKKIEVTFGTDYQDQAPKAPTKDATAEYTYTFSSWKYVEDEDTGNVTATPLFNYMANSYTVKWMDGDTVVKEETLDYGAEITKHAELTKEGYTFNGWDGYTTGMTMPAKDVTFTAKWQVNSYTVTWMNGNDKFAETTVNYGEQIAAPEGTPQKAKSEACEVFTFSGWGEIPETMPANENLVFYAQYNSKTIHEWQEQIVYSWDGSICTATHVCLYNLAHKETARPDEIKQIVDKTATCTETGTYHYEAIFNDGWAKGTSVGETSYTLAKDPNAHTIVYVAKVSATCVEAGVKEHWKCSGCDALFANEAGTIATTAEALAIDKSEAHTWKDACDSDCEIEDCTATREAPHDVEGVEWQSTETEHWKVCKLCSAEVNKAAHTVENGACGDCGKIFGVAQIGDQVYATLTDALADAATMTVDVTITLLADVEGEVTISQAVTINKGEFEFEYVVEGCYKAEISADGKTVAFVASHTPGEAVAENCVLPHNTDAGSYESVIYCSICFTELERKTVSVASPFKGTTMDLASNLGLNFYVDITMLSDNAHYAIITRSYTDSDKTDVVERKQADWTNAGGNNRRVVYNTIAAKEMCDQLHVDLYNAKGELVATYDDSIRDYAMRTIKKYSSVDKFNAMKLAMYVDLLNYGAAAQTNFTHNVNDLANGQISAELQQYATPAVTDSEDKRITAEGAYAGTVLDLDSEIKLNLIFEKRYVTDDMYAVISYTNHNGKKVEYTVQGAEFTNFSDVRWRITVKGLAIADGKSLVTCTIYDSNGTEKYVVQDSIESYCHRQAGKKPLYATILKLSRSAYTNLHPNA